MSDRRHKPPATYPDGLEAAILKALPSFRRRKRPIGELLTDLQEHQELRSAGVTIEQISAALHAMVATHQFRPGQYLSASPAGKHLQGAGAH
jgi:hypothetical protein